MSESVGQGRDAAGGQSALPCAARVCVTDLDDLLGVRFDVLDDGFVRLVDYLGSDASVVQAARVSYGEGTRHVSEDRALIRYLMRHRHTTPFEMCEIKLHVRVPMDCWRQWIRHRTASVNEYSTRYSLAIDAAQSTPPDAWRMQSDANRQGSSGNLPPEAGRRLSESERDLQELARKAYDERIAQGVAREQARKDLPLCTYTEAYWKLNLHNLLHFLELRMEAGAQAEIRAYAETIGQKIVSRWVPLVWEAFQDYCVKAMILSRLEIELLGVLLRGERETVVTLLHDWGWLRDGADGTLRRSREMREFETKLARMGCAAMTGLT